MKKIKVLHVEDDIMFTKFFARAYGEEFDIVSLPSSEGVLDVMQRDAIDLLVLDYVLPGKNGLQVLREVQEAFPSKPVIFYTGQGSEEVARQAFMSGASDYFVKTSFDTVQREKMINSVHKAMEKCAMAAELEEKRSMLERKVQERTVELTRLHQDIEARNRELEDFAYRVGHDMGNNLLVIRRLLELPELSQEHHQYLIEHTGRLMEFVEHVLELARAGRVIAVKKPIDGASLIKEVFYREKPDGIKAECRVSRSFPTIYGDRHSLEQVFTNLISNSFAHRGRDQEKVHITVSARATGDAIEISFRDKGPGIAPDIIGRIFLPSFTTRGKEHPGFGLAIAKKITEAHGGTIAIKNNTAGKGTTFTLTLPKS
jgi:signal transduction histidine kinase